MPDKPNRPADADTFRGRVYSGYFHRTPPASDDEITRVGPGTPLGEYMRRFWQPVCMSDQLGDVPLKIRIMGEDLVAFRDGDGQVGVLARNCCHRGASLEYGIVQQRGIRCCYHGFHYDVDGRLLDVPTEPDRGARLRQTVVQPAYPALERDGLVFAYLGAPDDRPPFPEWDAFEKYDDTRLVPYSNVYPCNWLQVVDNIADQMHTAILHQPAKLYDRTPPSDLDFGPLTLQSFSTVPLVDYVTVRNDTAMAFIAGRRTSDDLVWWRINECLLPNMTYHAYLFEDGTSRRLFHRVHMTRWYVPVDDTHTIIYGWRMFGKTIDPRQMGREDRVGWDDMDFLEGQVGNRPYETQQRLPGDWEAVVSQRPIAIHALEHPTSGDVGVYMYRRILRDAVRGANVNAHPAMMHERARQDLPMHSYTQNTMLNLRRRATDEEDKRLIREVGRRIVKIMSMADAHLGEQRNSFVRDELETIEREYQ